MGRHPAPVLGQPALSARKGFQVSRIIPGEEDVDSGPNSQALRDCPVDWFPESASVLPLSSAAAYRLLKKRATSSISRVTR